MVRVCFNFNLINQINKKINNPLVIIFAVLKQNKFTINHLCLFKFTVLVLEYLALVEIFHVFKHIAILNIDYIFFTN